MNSEHNDLSDCCEEAKRDREEPTDSSREIPGEPNRQGAILEARLFDPIPMGLGPDGAPIAGAWADNIPLTTFEVSNGVLVKFTGNPENNEVGCLETGGLHDGSNPIFGVDLRLTVNKR